MRRISTKAEWHSLYRAVDRHGKTVDFLLHRDIAAARAPFRRALALALPRVPRKVTLDGPVPSRRALWLLRRAHACWRNVRVWTNKYLNTSSSKTTAPSSDAARRWLDSNRTRTRRSIAASSFRIAFARDSSFLSVAIDVVAVAQSGMGNGTRIKEGREAKKASN